MNDNTCLVVGGSSKGQFFDKNKDYFSKIVSVDKNPLEAYIIISRVLYEYEKRIIM
jgi:rRNA small subunit pseudouridine methyltransferase Nep1